MRKSIALAVVAAVLMSGGIALAAQQGAAAKKLFVKVVNSQGFATRVVYLSKNMTATIAGDPVANGASFHIGFPGGETQCILLPPQKWEVIRGGFRYRDPTNLFGAVRVAAIKRSQTGRFRLRLVGTHAGIEPPDPATAYFTNFKINGGDEYCASTGSATPVKNDATTFLVKNDDGTACQPPCSSPSGAFLATSAPL